MNQITKQTPAASPPSINHFSHPHDLQPIPPNLPTPSHCSGCKLPSFGTMYGCSSHCNFALHHSCAELHRDIIHPSHGGCRLSLLTAASYSSGAFTCNACRRTGDGWNYHCSRCNYDLHITCVSKPLKVKHHSHSCDLHLTFKDPYTNGFFCNICHQKGWNQWLYLCSTCPFYVHLNCTAASPPSLQRFYSFPAAAPPHHHQLLHSANTGSFNYQQSQFIATPPYPGAAGVVPPAPTHLMHSASTGGIPSPYGVNHFQRPVYQLGSMQNNQPPYTATSGGLAVKLMMAAVEGLAQAVGQELVQGAIGGGVGGGGGSS